jgi:phospholipase/carboxylesterase
MTLFTGPRRANRIAGIVAFSGRFVSEVFNNMASLRKPPLLAMHGEKDTVIEVASHALLVTDMRKAGFIVQEEVLPGMGHVIGDPRQVAAGTAFLKRVFGLDRNHAPQPEPAGPKPAP